MGKEKSYYPWQLSFIMKRFTIGVCQCLLKVNLTLYFFFKCGSMLFHTLSKSLMLYRFISLHFTEFVNFPIPMTWFILLTRKQWNISYPLWHHCTKTICFFSIGNYLQESMPVLHSLLSHANPHNKHQGSNSSHVRNWRQWSEGQCCNQKKIKIRNSDIWKGLSYGSEIGYRKLPEKSLAPHTVE